MEHLLKLFNSAETALFSQRKRSFCVILMSDSSLPKDFISAVQKLAGPTGTGLEDSWDIDEGEIDGRLQSLLKDTREKESILLGLEIFKILKRDRVSEVHILLDDVQQFLLNYPYMHLLFNSPAPSPMSIVDKPALNKKAKIKIAYNYPQDILNGRMFLGNFNQAEQYNIIKDLGVTHVVNATLECKNLHENQGIKYSKLSVLDEADKPISELFEDAYSFIENALSSDPKNKVLIHCAQGKSRSATIVIMFLMKKLKWSFDQAHSYVKKKRSYIDPNDGFVKQLKEFEKGGCEFTKVI